MTSPPPQDPGAGPPDTSPTTSPPTPVTTPSASAAPAIAHEIVRASAGTGKTYALSTRYLALLYRGVAPRTILATTFTRKAAAEILGRVLTRLATAARDEAGAAALAGAITAPGMTVADARRMLREFCRELHHASILTIDGFFNRIVTTFRHELGVPANATIVGAGDPLAEQVRRDAIDALLGDDDPDVLVDLLRRLHHDQAQRSVTDALDRIVAELFEVYRQTRHHPEVWATLPADPPLDAGAQDAAIEALRGAEGLVPDKTRWRNAWQADCDYAAAQDWPGFLDHGLTKAIVERDGVYYRQPVPDDLRALYDPLIEHAAGALTAQVARRTEATLALLQRFDAHDDRLRRAHRLMLFSDLPLMLARDLPGGDELRQDIYYRLDTRVAHLMLDEFQDTSIEQWEVLYPFAEEVRAHGDGSRTFFCVGDVKQAIYGWRGGCAELFDRIERDLHLTGEARRSLNVSYRSSQIVLDAVNQVFEEIGANPVFADRPPCDRVAKVWQDRFERHTAHHTAMPGYVELITSPRPPEGEDAPEGGPGASVGGSPRSPGAVPMRTGDESETEDEPLGTPHDRFTAERVASITAAAPGHTVGVLVATNAQVGGVIDALRQEGVAASGEGGNPVTDDPAVRVVLSALTLADHPGDTEAAFHVFHSPLKSALGLTAPREPHTEKVAHRIRRELLDQGYAGVMTAWAKRLAPACDARSAVKLSQLIELADVYAPQTSLRPDDFVRFVSQTAVEEATPAAVRVMTVHRSKGLEFDVVVLPHLVRLLQSRFSVYVRRDGATGPIQAVIRDTQQAVRAIVPAIAEAHEQEQVRRLQDDISVLYVAMTRARHALHMIVPPLRQTKSGKPGTVGLTNLCYASVLRQALREHEDESFDGGEVLYAAGDPDWAPPAPRVTATSSPPPTGPARPVLTPAGPARRSWQRVAPSTLEGRGTVLASDLVAVRPAPARARGSVVHAWFEQVEWLADAEGLPPDEALLEIGRQTAPTAEGAWLAELLDDFKAMVASPATAAALAPPAAQAGEEVDLWRERPFAVRDGDRVLGGTFDRVLVFRRDSRPTRAELIDFKTDRVDEPGALADRTEQYEPQIRAYCTALARMLRLERSNIRARLLFVATGEEVVVEPE